MFMNHQTQNQTLGVQNPLQCPAQWSFKFSPFSSFHSLSDWKEVISAKTFLCLSNFPTLKVRVWIIKCLKSLLEFPLPILLQVLHLSTSRYILTCIHLYVLLLRMCVSRWFPQNVLQFPLSCRFLYVADSFMLQSF